MSADPSTPAASPAVRPVQTEAHERDEQTIRGTWAQSRWENRRVLPPQESRSQGSTCPQGGSLDREWPSSMI